MIYKSNKEIGKFSYSDMELHQFSKFLLIVRRSQSRHLQARHLQARQPQQKHPLSNPGIHE